MIENYPKEKQLANQAEAQTRLNAANSVIEHWDNGNKKCHFFVDANNNIQGECKSWYENGQLRFHGFYENDNLHGEIKRWYENGQLRFHGFYSDRQLIGALEGIKGY